MIRSIVIDSNNVIRVLVCNGELLVYYKYKTQRFKLLLRVTLDYSRSMEKAIMQSLLDIVELELEGSEMLYDICYKVIDKAALIERVRLLL